MILNDAPIRAYFAEAGYGNNHPATWFGAMWFTVLIWVIGQFILSIPMVIGIMVIEPDFLDKMPDGASEGGSAFTGLAFALSSILAIILYLVRPKNDPAAQRKMLSVAVIMAVISSICLALILSESDSETNAFFLSYIGKSAFVYGAMLMTFPVVVFGLFLAQRILHGRSIRSLLTAAPSFRWGRMMFSMIVFWIIAGGMTFIGHAFGNSPVEFVFDATRFWSFFFVSLLLIPLQSATEEIVLRGYLNQGLSRLIKSPWIIFIITSAGFAALHLGNPEIAQGAAEGSKWLTLSSYFFFGFFACVLTYIDGGLETAIGVHAANNLFAATVLGYDYSALPTPTVFKTGFNGGLEALTTIALLGLVCLVMYLTRAKAVAQLKSIDL